MISDCAVEEDISIGIAIEFMDHAASAYVSQYQGWFEEEGLDINSYESYVTGMALASALGRGDIQAAYEGDPAAKILLWASLRSMRVPEEKKHMAQKEPW